MVFRKWALSQAANCYVYEMLRYSLSILLCLVFVLGYSQSVGISPGMSYGRFYDFRKSEGHFLKEYQSQFGNSFSIEIKDIPIDTLFKIGFSINYQNYGGYFLTRNGGLGGSTTEEGEITKHVIGMEFYPFHIIIHRHFRLNFGISYSRLMAYKLSGTRSWWAAGPPLNTGTSELNDLENFVKPFYWGLISSFGYEFTAGNIKIEPRYSYYLGVSNDFNKLQAATSSMRHNFVLSISYNLK